MLPTSLSYERTTSGLNATEVLRLSSSHTVSSKAAAAGALEMMANVTLCSSDMGLGMIVWRPRQRTHLLAPRGRRRS